MLYCFGLVVCRVKVIWYCKSMTLRFKFCHFKTITLVTRFQAEVCSCTYNFKFLCR